MTDKNAQAQALEALKDAQSLLENNFDVRALRRVKDAIAALESAAPSAAEPVADANLAELAEVQFALTRIARRNPVAPSTGKASGGNPLAKRSLTIADAASIAEVGLMALDRFLKAATTAPSATSAAPTVIMDEKGERDAFEREMRDEKTWGHKSLARDQRGDYKNSWTAVMWTVWQARATLPTVTEAETSAEKAKPDGSYFPSALDEIRHLVCDITEEVRKDGCRHFQIIPGKELLFSNMVSVCVTLLEKEGIPADAPVAEPVAPAHGWVTMWPAMGGGHKPVYEQGSERPSYGKELDALLKVYPVYTRPPAPEEGKDAARYRWLRQQHEGRIDQELDADGVPMPSEPTAVAFTVFRPGEVGECHLEPVGCMPGELDGAIDTAMACAALSQGGGA